MACRSAGTILATIARTSRETRTTELRTVCPKTSRRAASRDGAFGLMLARCVEGSGRRCHEHTSAAGMR
jgi:hypothetical protein